MGGSYIGNAATFVVETVFGIYVLIVMLRFLLQLVHADFYNPLSQMLVTATQPPLKYLRRVIPAVGGIDLSSAVLALIVQFAQLLLVMLILGRNASVVGLLMLSVVRLLELTIYIMMFSVIILVVLSWIQPSTYNPIFGVLNSLSAPVMRPARRLVPPMGGLDLSAIVVLLALGVLLRVLIAPLEHMALRFL
ncbi:MAG: YggT family protein [Gammaproteobacteria bacterium]|jgi:YggT family protein